MLILSNENVASLLDSLSTEDIIDILKALATALGDHEILQPHRQSYTHPQPASSTTLIMPTFTSSSSSIKIVSLDTSPESQNTSPKGSLLLFSPDGSLDAVINAAEVTGFRTALASMIPVLLRFLPELVCKDYAAAGNFKSVPLDTALIFGAGLQAEWAVKLLLIFCSQKANPPTKIVIINRTMDRAQNLIKKLLLWHANKILPHTKSIPAFECHPYNTGKLRSLVTAADAIFCCTPSHNPHFPAFYLWSIQAQMKTRYISAIGSYTPEMKEIDSDLLTDNTLNFTTIVDTIEGCTVEAGEIITAQERMPFENQATESWMWEVGWTWDKANQADTKYKQQVRKTLGEGNIFYKSVGTGVMDLAVARELVKIARAVDSADTGFEVPGF